MIKKFCEALSLLWNHLGLFAAIILTIWLPGNILANLAYYHTDVSDVGLMWFNICVEGLLGPLYIGALVYALYRIKSGHSVTYREAMAVGFKKWGALFAATFVAGALVALGFVLLIVPGVILAVRYSLLDAAVIVEGLGTSQSLVRSTELTADRRSQILGAAILFAIPFLLLSFVIYLPLEFFESLNMLPLEIALDCVLNVGFSVIQIVMFLFYWEAIQTTASTESVPGTDDTITADQP